MSAKPKSPSTMETVEWQSFGGMNGSVIPIGDLVECQEGLIHVVSMAEYTLCGDALEGDQEAADSDSYVPASRATKKKTVTCPRCAEIVAICKRVRCKPNEKTEARP